MTMPSMAGLKGRVVSISARYDPRTKPSRRSIIIASSSRRRPTALVNKKGQRFPIVPGMIATVDIHNRQQDGAGLSHQAAEPGGRGAAGEVIATMQRLRLPRLLKMDHRLRLAAPDLERRRGRGAAPSGRSRSRLRANLRCRSAARRSASMKRCMVAYSSHRTVRHRAERPVGGGSSGGECIRYYAAGIEREAAPAAAGLFQR
jgi:hypothetical protein